MFAWIAKILNRIEKKNKGYVSDTDRMLSQWDKANPKQSPSQLHEIEKHRSIFHRRNKSRIQW